MLEVIGIHPIPSNSEGIFTVDLSEDRISALPKNLEKLKMLKFINLKNNKLSAAIKNQVGHKFNTCTVLVLK